MTDQSGGRQSLPGRWPSGAFQARSHAPRGRVFSAVTGLRITGDTGSIRTEAGAPEETTPAHVDRPEDNIPRSTTTRIPQEVPVPRGRLAELSPPTQTMLGSISLHVLGVSQCPAVTLRTDDPAVAAGWGHPSAARRNEIVAGVQEPAAAADPPLEFAFTTAELHGTRMHAVRALSLLHPHLVPVGTLWRPP